MAKRAALAQAQVQLGQAQRHLDRIENDFVRACVEIDRTGAAPAAHLERAVAAARSAVLRCRTETEELRNHALAAVRQREAAEALKARRMAEYAAREARKEERELDEANADRTNLLI
jgi:hypothetical protein